MKSINRVTANCCSVFCLGMSIPVEHVPIVSNSTDRLQYFWENLVTNIPREIHYLHYVRREHLQRIELVEEGLSRRVEAYIMER